MIVLLCSCRDPPKKKHTHTPTQPFTFTYKMVLRVKIEEVVRASRSPQAPMRREIWANDVSLIGFDRLDIEAFGD